MRNDKLQARYEAAVADLGFRDGSLEAQLLWDYTLAVKDLLADQAAATETVRSVPFAEYRALFVDTVVLLESAPDDAHCSVRLRDAKERVRERMAPLGTAAPPARGTPATGQPAVEHTCREYHDGCWQCVRAAKQALGARGTPACCADNLAGVTCDCAGEVGK
jgi:hypothetical protein